MVSITKPPARLLGEDGVLKCTMVECGPRGLILPLGARRLDELAGDLGLRLLHDQAPTMGRGGSVWVGLGWNPTNGARANPWGRRGACG